MTGANRSFPDWPRPSIHKPAAPAPWRVSRTIVANGTELIDYTSAPFGSYADAAFAAVNLIKQLRADGYSIIPTSNCTTVAVRDGETVHVEVREAQR